MAAKLTPELRNDIESGRRICAEIPAVTPHCLAWVTIGVGFENDAVSTYGLMHFEFRLEWLEREYDPSREEFPIFETHRFPTEGELTPYLADTLPESTNFMSVADDPDYPL